MKLMTPCDEPWDWYDEETGRWIKKSICPYEDYGGSDRRRVCCGIGVDEDGEEYNYE